MNKTMMGKSGYFTRKAMLVTSGIKLKQSHGGCNSVNPIMYEVKTPEHLRRLRGRYYRTPSMGRFEILKGTEKELIGRSILVKSPETCESLSKGYGVCEECYGPLLYHTNKSIDVGSYASATATNPVGQNILSTKHLLTTDSVLIEFNKEFETYCDLSSNEVTINDQNVKTSDYSIIIIKENIISLNNLNEGSFDEFVTLFHIRNDVTGEIIEMRDENYIELFLSPYFKKKLKLSKDRTAYEVKMSAVDPEEPIFLIQIENNELTRPLYDIIGVLDSDISRKKMGISDDPSVIAQALLDLFIKSDINIMAVHAEVMVAPLIRSKENILVRPRFSRYSAMEDTQVLTITSALVNNPSPLIGLAFAQLKRQLRSPLTYKKRGESFVDPFFKKNI